MSRSEMDASKGALQGGPRCSVYGTRELPATRVIVKYAYLLLFGGGLQDVIHQNRHEFCHSVDASGVGSIRGRAVYCLRLRLGLLEPFSGYRVYDVEYPQLVCSRCLLKVCKDFLNKD
jgi:hypothetical protein